VARHSRDGEGAAASISSPQKNGVKYVYSVTEQLFRVETSSGALAPPSIQYLLSRPDVIIAIAKGLTILGY